MLCPVCGTAVSEGGRFCTQCGFDFAAQQQPQPQQPVYQQPQQPVYQQPQQPVYQQPQQPVYQQPQQPVYQQPVNPQTPLAPQPMAWYKFLIYFALFASALINIGQGGMLLNGSQYGNFGEAEAVYSAISGLQVLDIMVALLSIALGVFALVTRFQLSGYKKAAPNCVVMTYLFAAVINLIYVIGLNIILGDYPRLEAALDDISVTSGTQIAVGLLIASLNSTYFKKRKYLFVN